MYRLRYRLLRPRETKEYGPRSDVQTPVLQYLVSALVILLGALLVLSWIVLMPPLVPWLAGMALAFVTPAVGWWYGMGWLLKWMGAYENGVERAFIAHLLTTIVAIVTSALWCYNQVWDWWEGLCYSGFFGIPTPHLDAGSPLLWIGVALFLLGAVFILWKPSGYTFSIQAVGAVFSLVSWYLRAPTLHWTKGATEVLSQGDLLFYGVWFAISISVWAPAYFLLDRMFTEMRDDFPYEGDMKQPAAPTTVTQDVHHILPSSGGRPRPSLTPPAVIATFNGTDETIVRVDEFIEFLYLVQRRGTFSRRQLFPYRFDCSRRQVTQWNHWVELTHPLDPDVYDSAAKEIQPEYRREDGTLDAENVIAMMTLGELQNGRATVGDGS